FEVIHHSDYMLGLVAEKKLIPKQPVKGKVAYHDSCYLGRYNDIYDSPRQILQAIPGVELVEVEGWNKKKGLCCGAGGAQMFMEEQNKDRVNVKRTLQLVDALGAPTNVGNAHGHGPNTIASACPFCMTMLKDGVKAQSKEEEIQNLDIVELLAQSCGVREPAPAAGDAGDAAAPAA
ncbi:MAG: (Fe-S)-binding protein, partial [Myxococcales bacterium]